MLKLGRKLKTLRKINNISPKEVCKYLERNYNLKFTPAAVYKWEENVVEPNIYTLLALTNLYHSTISFILGDVFMELNSLQNQEKKYLELFRYDNLFMQIATLSKEYLERNQKMQTSMQKITK